MSLNGFDMNCVDLVAKGVPGTSTVCTTSQGILGYAKVASGFHQLPDHELFAVTPGVHVPATAGRHGDDTDDIAETTSFGSPVTNEGMTTFITRYDTSGPGVRLAVKDLIDMAGEPTTAGCRAVADRGRAGRADAACLAGARAGGRADRRAGPTSTSSPSG